MARIKLQATTLRCHNITSWKYMSQYVPVIYVLDKNWHKLANWRHLQAASQPAWQCYGDLLGRMLISKFQLLVPQEPQPTLTSKVWSRCHQTPPKHFALPLLWHWGGLLLRPHQENNRHAAHKANIIYNKVSKLHAPQIVWFFCLDFGHVLYFKHVEHL